MLYNISSTIEQLHSVPWNINEMPLTQSESQYFTSDVHLLVAWYLCITELR